MGFGKRLKCEAEQFAPEFQTRVLNYKVLKESLYNDLSQNVVSIDSGQPQVETGNTFIIQLTTQLVAVNKFYLKKIDALEYKVGKLIAVSPTPSLNTDHAYENISKDLYRSVYEANRLKRFLTLNYIAVLKILKKYDKNALNIGREPLKDRALPILTNFPFYKDLRVARVLTDLKIFFYEYNQNDQAIPFQTVDFCCPICFEPLVDSPITLSCSHSFCQTCILKAHMTCKLTSCPTCRKPNVVNPNSLTVDVRLQKLLVDNLPRLKRELRFQTGKESGSDTSSDAGSDTSTSPEDRNAVKRAEKSGAPIKNGIPEEMSAKVNRTPVPPTVEVNWTTCFGGATWKLVTVILVFHLMSSPHQSLPVTLIMSLLSVAVVAVLCSLYRLPAHAKSSAELMVQFGGLTVGHRGCRGVSDQLPENSMPAFRHALKHGAHALEFDVRMTKDGVPIVFHDADVARMLEGAEGAVESFTFNEIRSYKYRGVNQDTMSPQDAVVPSLEELFQFIQQKQCKLFLEMKGVDRILAICRTVVSLIQVYELQDLVVIISFNPAHLYQVRSLDARLPTCVLYDNATVSGSLKNETIFTRNPAYVQQCFNFIAVQLLDRLFMALAPSFIPYIVGASFMGPVHTLLSNDVIEKWLKSGYLTYTWTVNDFAELNWLVELNRVSCGTDRCFNIPPTTIPVPAAIPTEARRHSVGGKLESASAVRSDVELMAQRRTSTFKKKLNVKHGKSLSLKQRDVPRVNNNMHLSDRIPLDMRVPTANLLPSDVIDPTPSRPFLEPMPSSSPPSSLAKLPSAATVSHQDQLRNIFSQPPPVDVSLRWDSEPILSGRVDPALVRANVLSAEVC